MTSALLLWFGALLLFVGLAALVLVALGGLETPEHPGGSVQDRLAMYTLGEAPSPQPANARPDARSVRAAVAHTAVELAGRLVRGRDIEGSLARQLDQSAVPLSPAEWTLVHIGSALGLAVLLGLLGGIRPMPALLGLVVGAAAPLVVLRVRADRRKAAFDGELADSLQLLAGSLRAGYSVPQAIDAIVREGEEPMTTEFGRALVEARLGVPLEDALESVGRRMQSVDFGWVVMAMRIQRDVGGNLAEVLTNVAATLRERERLRRQVRVLSAEGRLSAWILGLLPIVFGGYLLLVRPDYLRPLWTTTLGWLMLATAAGLFVVGVFWLRRVVRVVV
jgi:tight adherence protein B